jgi:membrane protein DedA with SNARE-associated domain
VFRFSFSDITMDLRSGPMNTLSLARSKSVLVTRSRLDRAAYSAASLTRFSRSAALFDAWGPWILIAKGWTPFPYKVLTIAAGVFKMSFVPFVLASIVARAMRFYLVAGLLYWFGEPIREFIDKRLSLVTTAFVILLVGGFVAIRFLF